MKILITGGAGYLGTQLVQELASCSEVSGIVVYDNLSRGNFNFFLGDAIQGCEVEFVRADVLDSRSLRKAVADVDVVYHLAAKVTTPFADQSAQQFEQINHWGTAEAAYAVESANIDKFVFLSSASVYGTSENEVDELTRPDPKTIYGQSKLKAERHVGRLEEKGVQTYIIRCGNIFGYNPSMRFDAVINRFVFQANFFRKISINGDGEQFRSFIHVCRAAKILAKIPFSDLSPGCLNLVEQTLTVNEIANSLQVVFPDLERVYVNQDLQLNQLKVKPNDILNVLEPATTPLILDVLTDFANRFAF